MYTIILALHVFVCILLIIAVLLQNSKSSDLGAALGGGSGEMFGPKAPSTIMNKITTVIAAAFLILSLILAVLSTSNEESIMQGGISAIPQSPVDMGIPSQNTGAAPVQNQENAVPFNTPAK